MSSIKANKCSIESLGFLVSTKGHLLMEGLSKSAQVQYLKPHMRGNRNRNVIFQKQYFIKKRTFFKKALIVFIFTILFQMQPLLSFKREEKITYLQYYISV